MAYLFFIIFTSVKYKKWKISIGAIVHFVILILVALISQFVLLMSLGVGISAGEPY
jgi:cadmium resistance protein CadD (predicted permease)